MPNSFAHKRVLATILVFGFVITGILTAWVRTLAEEKEEIRLNAMAEEAIHKISSSINIMTYGLRGAVGLFAASAEVESNEFKSYVSSRSLKEEFPGALGFGYIEVVERRALDSFLKSVDYKAYPDYHLRSSGDRPRLYIIKYIEPAAINSVSLGFDIGSEDHRRNAAELAMATGLPTLTKKISLLQDKESRAGFLYLMPLYKKSMPLNSPEERTKAIKGWAYAPIILEETLAPAIREFGSMLTISVYEGDGADEKNLLNRSIEVERRSKKFVKTEKVNIGQQVWTIEVLPKAAFFNASAMEYLPISVGALGVLLTLLTSAGFRVYLDKRQRSFDNKIKEGEQFVKGIVDSASFSIIVTGTNGVIRIFNDSAAKMLGYTPEEVIGKQTPAMIHDPKEVEIRAKELSEELGIKVEPGFEVFVAKSKLRLYDKNEWSYVRKDGTILPVSLSVTAIRDYRNEIIGFMGIAEDISERKLAETKLQESEERFKSSFSHASHGIALVGTDGRWLKVNPALCQILGYTEGELLKKTFQDITHPEDLHTDIELMNKTLAGEIENYHMEKRYFHASGETVWILLSVSLVKDHDNQPIHFVSQIQDITLQKKSEEALKVSQKIAISAAQSKSQFLANMSHEIRTPLTSIIGYSESLMSDELTEEEENLALATVIKNGNHLLGVINDILDLSKIEAGKLEVERIPTDLAELISDVANLMQHKAREEGLSLGFDYILPIPRKIITDPIRLKQILINLVGNAIKFTTVGGVKINVIHKKEENLITFDVIDTGSGLSPEQQAKLFQAFTQADPTITRKFGGTGLGLVISSELAQKLGGGITVQSELGKGSTFSLSVATGDINDDYLHKNPRGMSKRNKLPQAQEAPQLKGKVLVAEDGEDNRRLISFLLKKTGVEFTIVENGALAVEAVSTKPFDLILMDVQMPIMDGYTATKKIRENGFDVPIIALTANAMKSDQELAYEAKCTDFLGKPFTRAEFFSKLSNALSPVATARESIGEALTQTLGIRAEDQEAVELVRSIISKLPVRLAEIEKAVEDKNWEEASRAAHSLKGASSLIGLSSIADLAAYIEGAAEKQEANNAIKECENLRNLIEDAQVFTSAPLFN